MKRQIRPITRLIHRLPVALLSFLPLLRAAGAEAPRTVFTADFGSSNSLAVWGALPAGVTLAQGRTGAGLAVARGTNEGPGSVTLSTALPLEALRGCRVRCDARVRAENVARPPNAWNGIKVMLHTDSASEGKRWDQQNSLFGTFDWRRVRFTTWVPENASVARLVLGLENTTGQAWFDDVELTVVRDPRTAPRVTAGAGPPFKGHDELRLRGAMVHPDVSADSLRVLGGDWKANAIRWQLIRYVAPGKETPLGEFDAWLEGELNKLERALPLCAEQGLRVVIDLHSPPGGSRTVSGYIGSDTGLFTNRQAQAKFVQVWRNIARRYRDNTAVWGYDLANEPVEEELGDECDDWQELATRAARAVREVDSRHAIIVEPSPWGGPGAIRNLDPLPGPGVVYSVHMYVPGQFTHQGIHGNPGGVTYPGMVDGRPLDKAALRRTLEPVIEFQRRHNAHIYIGEFSAIRWAPGAAEYLRDCIELFEEHGWDWTYHAFREWSGWSVEHGSDPNDTKPSATPTARQKLLLEWFARNKSG